MNVINYCDSSIKAYLCDLLFMLQFGHVSELFFITKSKKSLCDMKNQMSTVNENRCHSYVNPPCNSIEKNNYKHFLTLRNDCQSCILFMVIKHLLFGLCKYLQNKFVSLAKFK